MGESQNKQTGNSTGGSIMWHTHPGVQEELGNGVDGSFYADNLAMYITIRNQRVAARALQGVTNKLNAWAAERGLTFSNSKTVSMVFRKKKKEKWRTNENHTKKSNHT